MQNSRKNVVKSMETTEVAAAAAFTAQNPGTAASSKILQTGPPGSNPSQEDLPSEVVCEIFQYLDLNSLLKCRLVCSRFRSLIDSTASLQYQIELAVSGQQDGSYSDISTRRAMLKMHQKRWDGLQWTEVLRVRRISKYWGLCGGMFAQASKNPYTLHIKRLPSQSRRIKEKNWILDLSSLFGKETRMGKFLMDPSQDLLVVVARARARARAGFSTDEGFRIHLLTLSKGEPHPLTSEPWLAHHDLDPEAERRWYCIDICHDFLSIRFIGGIVIWNWKTGQVLMHIVNCYEIASMIFLNERYVLLASVGVHTPYLLAVDFLSVPPEQRCLQELEHYFIFWFPAISDPSPLANIDNIIDELDIAIQSNPRSTWRADTDPSVPFSMVPQDRLFVVYLFSNNVGEDLCFAILEASFLSLIKTGLRVNNNQFNWSMWGPEHSRTLPNRSFSSTWPFPSHGTRLAMKRHLLHREISVDIFDFSPLGCRNKKQDSNAETPGDVNASESTEIIEGQPVCVFAPTKIKGNLFRDQVDTRLSYTVTSWSVPRKPQVGFISVMCSEDAVIIVDEDNDSEMYEIYTV